MSNLVLALTQIQCLLDHVLERMYGSLGEIPEVLGDIHLEIGSENQIEPSFDLVCSRSIEIYRNDFGAELSHSVERVVGVFTEDFHVSRAETSSARTQETLT